MNITRRAVKALSLHHLFYEIFKYLPINLFVINLVVSCSLKKHAKKVFSKFCQNPWKIPVKVLIFIKRKNVIFKFFFNFTKNEHFDRYFLRILTKL